MPELLGRAIDLFRKAASWTAVATALALCWPAGGCTISRTIVELTPPAGQPALQELEGHLDYADPDAGRPSYVRAQ